MSRRVRSSTASAAAVFFLTLSLVLSMPAVAAPTPCWQRVIGDWARNGSVRGGYPASCLREAMQNAPADLRIYSSLESDLKLALAVGTKAPRRLAVEPAAHKKAIASTATGTSLDSLVALLAALGVLVASAAAFAAVIKTRRARRSASALPARR